MTPLNLEIYDEQLIAFIRTQTEKSKESPLQYITRLIQSDISHQRELPIEDAISLTQSIFSIYAEEYKKRFGVEAPYENGEARKVVGQTVAEMLRSGLNLEQVQEKLSHAVSWYLNFHENQDSNGQNYPYGLKYLFSKTNNSWLLRSCIESSYKLNDKVFRLMQSSGLSREEAIRSVRRGDRAGSQVQESKVARLDDALKIYAKVRKFREFLPKDFKFLPQIDLLFKSETPDEKYITEAVDFLKKVLVVMEKKHGER